MSGDAESAGGTPGAQTSIDSTFFNYSEAAWESIQRAAGPLSADHRWELRFIASSFLQSRSRKEQFNAEMVRQSRHLRIADAAQNLLDALAYERRWTTRENLYAELEQLAHGHSAMARYSRETAPANAAKPDRSYFLYRLCAFWERRVGEAPTVAFRQKVSGNYLVGEKYGAAVDFLMAAGTEPSLAKEQKPVTPDTAAAAVASYNDPSAVQRLELDEGRRALDDLTNPVDPHMGE